MHPFQKGITVTGVHSFTRFDYPLCKEREVTKEDFKRIAGMGFDHVRLLIDHSKLIDNNCRPLALKEEGWRRLDTVLEWIASCGLKSVVCLRSAPGYCYRDAENLKERANTLFFFQGQVDLLRDLWLEFDRRYAGTEEFVAFEILDRVGFAFSANNLPVKGFGWNYVAPRVTLPVWKQNPKRWIIVGTDTFGSADGLSDVAMYTAGERVIYAFQFYKPELFTKQAAFNHTVVSDYFSIKHEIKSEMIRYPGIIPGIDKFLDRFPKYASQMDHYRNVVINDEITEKYDFAPVRAFMEKYPNAELYASAFASVLYSDPQSRHNWLSCVVRLFENNGIGHCYYRYLGSRWGIVDAMQEEVVDEVALRALRIEN